MKYVVILEPTESGYSAYAPDLPGCVAAAATIEATEALIGDAIARHLQLLRETGEFVPQPVSPNVAERK